MNKNIKKSVFTFIEILAAVLILALGLTATLYLSATATARTTKAKEKWAAQHIMTQAAEFHLLVGSEASIPEEIFPYNGYKIKCSETEPEGLPDNCKPEMGDWKLTTFVLELESDDGKISEELKIDKIIKVDSK